VVQPRPGRAGRGDNGGMTAGFVFGPGEGPAYGFHGSAVVIKASGEDTFGQLGVMESVYPAGLSVHEHVHAGEDEMFYLLDGEMTVFCGGGQLERRAGQLRLRAPRPAAPPHRRRLRAGPGAGDHRPVPAGRAGGRPRRTRPAGAGNLRRAAVSGGKSRSISRTGGLSALVRVRRPDGPSAGPACSGFLKARSDHGDDGSQRGVVAEVEDAFLILLLSYSRPGTALLSALSRGRGMALLLVAARGWPCSPRRWRVAPVAAYLRPR
jgi:hypothetical protein